MKKGSLIELGEEAIVEAGGDAGDVSHLEVDGRTLPQEVEGDKWAQLRASCELCRA